MLSTPQKRMHIVFFPFFPLCPPDSVILYKVCQTFHLGDAISSQESIFLNSFLSFFSLVQGQPEEIVNRSIRNSKLNSVPVEKVKQKRLLQSHVGVVCDIIFLKRFICTLTMSIWSKMVLKQTLQHDQVSCDEGLQHTYF